MFYGCKEVLWLRQLLEDLGFKQEGPTEVYVDNESAIAIAGNKTTKKAKHIRTKYHAVKECVKNGEVVFFGVDGKENVADLLTKAVNAETLNNLRAMLLGAKNIDWERLKRG